MSTFAGKFSPSGQTLFRRLKAWGVTIQKGLNELRHKLALHYLSRKKVLVKVTAHLLGFYAGVPYSRSPSSGLP